MHSTRGVPVMSKSLDSSTWFTNLRPNREARLRLFCFPYAGGASTIFRQWPQRLPANVQVSAAQLPGRGPRTREAPFKSLPALVEQITLAIEPHLDRPFAFFGYSLGAIVAFELARRLRQQGGLEPLRLFVAACRAPQIPETHEPTYNLPEPELLDRLRRLNGTPKEVLEHPELIQLMLPLLRADFEMVETYAYAAAPPLRSPISAFGGLHDQEVKREHLEAWRDQTTGDFNIRMFEGDHFFIHQAEPLLLDVIARELIQS
jgi:medium-chain acyl-[acyl-carrier-protein] hydrolase